MRTNLSSTLGEALLTTTVLPAPETTIAGHKFNWTPGIMLGATYATGTDLMLKNQQVYGTGMQTLVCRGLYYQLSRQMGNGIEVRMGAQRFDELQFVEVCAMYAARQTEVRRTWLNSMPLRQMGGL